MEIAAEPRDGSALLKQLVEKRVALISEIFPWKPFKCIYQKNIGRFARNRYGRRGSSQIQFAHGRSSMPLDRHTAGILADTQTHR